MKKLLIFFTAVQLMATHVTAQQQEYFPDPEPGIQQRLEDWQDLKFGLLMHWGTYSQWGIVESWSICPEDLSWATGGRKPGVADDYFTYVKKYEALQQTFNPVQFNPEKWAAAAKQAGMKYMVFTTKHHDGFCMFDTKQTDYRITDPKTPFSKNARSNIAKEVFEAFRKNNFWIGAYFSKPDWHSDYYWWKKFPPADRNPSYTVSKYPDQWKKFVHYTQAQIDELMSGYGKLDILWLDGGWVRKKTEEEVNKDLMDVYENSRWARIPQSQDIDMPAIVANARKKQPGLIVVDRAVPGIHQNYLTPEQHIPETGLPYPWETCMTMATSWSYVPGDTYKPTTELVKKLVDVVSKGGNFLLNIGPSPSGELDTAAYDRLKGIGDWMKINGEAIYGSRKYKTFEEGEAVRFTQSKDGKTVYVFLFEMPGTKVELGKVAYASSMKVQLLGSKAKVKVRTAGEGIALEIPKGAGKDLKHVWVVKLSR
ncbi:MAG: alpha-L-fucosidase [Ferruginibacter sp.]